MSVEQEFRQIRGIARRILDILHTRLDQTGEFIELNFIPLAEAMLQ